MLALFGGDGWGRFRGDIAGAQDKVSAGGIPEQRCIVIPNLAGVTASGTES
ncbi:unnamed protein product [Staurois parvus]|uniref:Uncharacterized protein n=1 Tax=Staurois parvus TaxID=386267 RepID=A0ABN9CF57_9NEOB|nr:unnamed protein product [Staurois parvus]